MDSKKRIILGALICLLVLAFSVARHPKDQELTCSKLVSNDNETIEENVKFTFSKSQLVRMLDISISSYNDEITFNSSVEHASDLKQTLDAHEGYNLDVIKNDKDLKLIFIRTCNDVEDVDFKTSLTSQKLLIKNDYCTSSINKIKKSMKDEGYSCR